MRVFVTGASGFVGSAIVKDLLTAGHQVLGLARSDSSAQSLLNMGAEVHRGDIYDLESITSGAASCNGVIHTAFNHDFSKFKENCDTDRLVIRALGSALAGTDKPLVITSGIGLIHQQRMVVERDSPPPASEVPRAATEEAAHDAAAVGVRTYIVRLPPTVHGKGDHGFVPMVIGMAKEKGESVYIGEGHNCWPAVHRFDAAAVYRRIIEQLPEQKVFHAVAESGVPFREIAETIGRGLRVPVVSKMAEEAEAHFTWFMRFATIDSRASSDLTKSVLSWTPVEVNLIDDMNANYF